MSTNRPEWERIDLKENIHQINNLIKLEDLH